MLKSASLFVYHIMSTGKKDKRIVIEEADSAMTVKSSRSEFTGIMNKRC